MSTHKLIITETHKKTGEVRRHDVEEFLSIYNANRRMSQVLDKKKDLAEDGVALEVVLEEYKSPIVGSY